MKTVKEVSQRRVHMNITLSPELANYVKTHAEENGISRSASIELLLRGTVLLEKKENR
jgi:hypothetical protein